MTPESIETTRLILRPFTLSDAEIAFGWLGDPNVMQFTPAGADASLETTRRRIAMYMEHQTAHRFSKWIMFDRATGEPVGDAGLLVLKGSGNIDLGFRLARRYWGQGLATQVASAWIRAAFVDFRLNHLTAIAHPQNHASRRVLEKVGFRVQEVGQVVGMDAISFSLDVEDFQRRCSNSC